MQILATASSSLDFVRATIVTWLPRLANSLARASPILPGRAGRDPLSGWRRERAGTVEGVQRQRSAAGGYPEEPPEITTCLPL